MSWWVSTFLSSPRKIPSPNPSINPSIHLNHLSLKLPLNRALNSLRLSSASPAALDFTVLADEELLKVPLDALQAHKPGLLLLHPLPHRLGGVAVDVGLAQHLVRDLVTEHTEVLDLFVGARVLAAELVAGEGEDFEVLVGGFEVWGEVC